MSPPTMNPSAHMSQYNASPVDAMDRHEFGVQKNRKPASTGGGRAWSEDEEVYLLQTRLQKMPYKHIAAHLKKTELACRLHYHQLSHGSNRRKRTTSVSSGSSVRSPIMHGASMPSPIHEADHISNHSTSPYENAYSPASETSHIILPSAAALLTATSQRGPVAILPKPSPPRRALSDSGAAPPLRLNCAVSASSPQTVSSIDKKRLRSIYNSHRAAFWLGIAAEYGDGVNPLLLEEAWKRGSINAPPTPCISPDSNVGYNMSRIEYKEGTAKATSISALLGIDASPRSPKEREMIKRLEEETRDVRMEMA